MCLHDELQTKYHIVKRASCIYIVIIVTKKYFKNLDYDVMLWHDIPPLNTTLWELEHCLCNITTQHF